MSMDRSYEAWHKLVDGLHYRVQDTFDEPDDRACLELRIEMRELISDFELQKSPRDIENRIKHIIDILEPARNGSIPFMSVGDAVTFHDAFERLRRDVRTHPHYS
jgi:hypothetical protein